VRGGGCEDGGGMQACLVGAVVVGVGYGGAAWCAHRTVSPTSNQAEEDARGGRAVRGWKQRSGQGVGMRGSGASCANDAPFMLF